MLQQDEHGLKADAIRCLLTLDPRTLGGTGMGCKEHELLNETTEDSRSASTIYLGRVLMSVSPHPFPSYKTSLQVVVQLPENINDPSSSALSLSRWHLLID